MPGFTWWPMLVLPALVRWWKEGQGHQNFKPTGVHVLWNFLTIKTHHFPQYSVSMGICYCRNAYKNEVGWKFWVLVRKQVLWPVSSKRGIVLGMCFCAPPKCSWQELIWLQITHYCLLLFAIKCLKCLYGKTYFCHMQLVLDCLQRELAGTLLMRFLLALRVETVWCSE